MSKLIITTAMALQTEDEKLTNHITASMFDNNSLSTEQSNVEIADKETKEILLHARPSQARCYQRNPLIFSIPLCRMIMNSSLVLCI